MAEVAMRGGIVVGEVGDFGIRVLDCPANGIMDAVGIPIMYCVAGVGPTPETSPNLRHCRYLVVDEMEPAAEDRTVQVACSYAKDE